VVRRIAIFCEALSLERERVLGWGIVQCVLSAWWSFDSGEDKESWQPTLEFGEVLSALA
jgi:streptomycin 6-kinase